MYDFIKLHGIFSNPSQSQVTPEPGMLMRGGVAEKENPIAFALGKRNSGDLRPLEHNWNSSKMHCLRGAVGMEVAYGDV